MIVVFIVVLVVFGPQKLPELARGLGKLMAEFRKASTEFKAAFEEEMRDLERQALLAQRKKSAEAAAASGSAEPIQSALPAPGAITETAAGEAAPEAQVSEAPGSPVPESVARGSASPAEAKAEPAAANLQEAPQDAPHSA